MKNKLCMLFAIVLLLVGGCNEKSQNYFARDNFENNR